MNAKKCKKVRKQLRSIGVNVREAIGAVGHGYFKTVMRTSGISETVHVNVGTLTLDVGCGRYQYKRLKARYSGYLDGAF